MRKREAPKRCTVRACRAPAAYVYEAGGGDRWERITVGGKRVRVCPGHQMGVSQTLIAALQQLPDGGPARLRAVPLTPL